MPKLDESLDKEFPGGKTGALRLAVMWLKYAEDSDKLEEFHNVITGIIKRSITIRDKI